MTRASKPLKFWHQSMTELAGQGAYSRYLSSHAKKILGDEADVHIRGLKAGSYHGHALTEALENAFVYYRVLDQVIDNAIQADREGYDAFVIGSFSEPYLREIRSAVNLSLVSVLEPSMLVRLLDDSALEVSRVGHYARPSLELMAAFAPKD